MEKELQNEIESLIELHLEDFKETILVEVKRVIKDETAGLKGSKEDIQNTVEAVIDSKLKAFKDELGGGNPMSKLKPNPKYQPEWKEDDDTTGNWKKDTILVQALPGAPYHEEGYQWEQPGTNALHLIQKGYAKFVKVAKHYSPEPEAPSKGTGKRK